MKEPSRCNYSTEIAGEYLCWANKENCKRVDNTNCPICDEYIDPIKKLTGMLFGNISEAKE